MALSVKRSDLFRIPLGQIEIEVGFNVREELKNIPELALSMHNLGQQTPAIVYKKRGTDTYVLTTGHRRFAAILEANEKHGSGIEYLEAKKTSSDAKQRLMTMLLDGEGSTQRLSNAEMMEGVARLIELGVPNKEIVDSLCASVSVPQAYNIINTAKAPQEIRDMISNGEISVALVNDIQRDTSSNEEQVEVAKQAVENAKAQGKKKATGKNRKDAKGVEKSKTNSTVQRLKDAIALAKENGANESSVQMAVAEALVQKLETRSSVEDIAKIFA